MSLVTQIAQAVVTELIDFWTGYTRFTGNIVTVCFINSPNTLFK
jgi:hypothetical protein